MKQAQESLDSFDHEGAKEKLVNWLNEGQLFHLWKEDEANFPVYKAVVGTNQHLYFVRLFPGINYDTGEIDDNWNISIDREAEYPQGFTFDELPNSNIGEEEGHDNTNKKTSHRVH